jgi:hypothetical protein
VARGGQIDNRQSAMAEPDSRVAIDPNSLVVGATVSNWADHPPYDIWRHLAAA